MHVHCVCMSSPSHLMHHMPPGACLHSSLFRRTSALSKSTNDCLLNRWVLIGASYSHSCLLGSMLTRTAGTAAAAAAPTTPEQILTALSASGDWGKVSESPNSGERNVLDGTDNILLNANVFAAVAFEPQNLSITGGTDGFGPFQVSISLSQVCAWLPALPAHA